MIHNSNNPNWTNFTSSRWNFFKVSKPILLIKMDCKIRIKHKKKSKTFKKIKKPFKILSQFKNDPMNKFFKLKNINAVINLGNDCELSFIYKLSNIIDLIFLMDAKFMEKYMNASNWFKKLLKCSTTRRNNCKWWKTKWNKTVLINPKAMNKHSSIVLKK